MPIHLDDLDVVSDLAGVKSALIVPCNMCPAITVAVNEKKPFIRLFRHFLKSAPFEKHIRELQSRLSAEGVETEVFNSRLPHHWFLCMWSSGQRKKLERRARRHDAAIVLGCDTANETVRDAVRSTGCKVIEGMEVTGFMNAKLKVHLPCDVYLEDCKIIPMPRRSPDKNTSH